MQVTNILPSTAVQFFSSRNLRSIFLPDVVQHITELFSFFESPQTADKLSLDEGLKFLMGRHQDRTIIKLELFASGIAVQACENTNKLTEVVLFITAELNQKFGVDFISAAPLEFAYASTLEFQADPAFSQFAGKFSEISSMINQKVAELGFISKGFDLGSIAFSADQQFVTPTALGMFKIERRINHNFDENIFYAEAPLKTNDHIEILKTLEKCFE